MEPFLPPSSSRQGALTFSNTAVGSASPAQTITLTNNGNTSVRCARNDPAERLRRDHQLPDFAARGSLQLCHLLHEPTNALTAGTRTGVLQIKTDASTCA